MFGARGDCSRTVVVEGGCRTGVCCVGFVGVVFVVEVVERFEVTLVDTIGVEAIASGLTDCGVETFSIMA